MAPGMNTCFYITCDDPVMYEETWAEIWDRGPASMSRYCRVHAFYWWWKFKRTQIKGVKFVRIVHG